MGDRYPLGELRPKSGSMTFDRMPQMSLRSFHHHTTGWDKNYPPIDKVHAYRDLIYAFSTSQKSTLAFRCNFWPTLYITSICHCFGAQLLANPTYHCSLLFLWEHLVYDPTLYITPTCPADKFEKLKAGFYTLGIIFCC